MGTREDTELWEQISKIPIKNGTLTYHSMSRIITMHPSSSTMSLSVDVSNDSNDTTTPKVIVACAGTTDVPIAEEACITLQSTQSLSVERVYDVGVAGLHRILKALPKLQCPSVKC